MSEFCKTIPTADGGYIVDYGDLQLPVPPADMPLRPDDLQASLELLANQLGETNYPPDFEEQRLARKANERFEM